MARTTSTLLLLLALGLASTFGVRAFDDADEQPWTHLPLHGLGGLPQNDSASLGRKLRQTVGPLATQTSASGLGAVGQYKECNVYSATSTLKCAGNYPFPACCNSLYCSTKADGSGGRCTSEGPYPACCPAFSRGADKCLLPDLSRTCSARSYPVPACCDSSRCYVFADGSSTKCTANRVAKCCPA